jgi:hypothetical protein
MVPISDFEKKLFAEIPGTEPEKIIPSHHRRPTFFDRLVMLLGGYRP